MFCVLFGLVRFGSFVAQSCCMHVARRSNIHTHVRPYFFFIIVELNLLDTIRFCKTNQLQVLSFLLDAQTQRFFFAIFSSSFVANGSTIFAIKNLRLDSSVLFARCVCLMWMCVKHQQRSFKEESAN